MEGKGEIIRALKEQKVYPEESNQVLNASELEVGQVYEVVSHFLKSTHRYKFKLLAIGPSHNLEEGNIRVDISYSKTPVNLSLADKGVIAYDNGSWNPFHCVVLHKG